jgi:hypothetical protein
MSFPAFSEYQHAFDDQLDSKIFSYVTPPKWLPQPPQLCHMAKLIYPHWRERRMERGGQRIIPTLNVTLSPLSVFAAHHLFYFSSSMNPTRSMNPTSVSAAEM